MKILDVFISGETMNLCIPTEEFSKASKWYSWFNDSKITKYLEQGIFPNTPDDQGAFYSSQKNKRLILIISNKKEYMGVISLSGIDLSKKICDIAIVVDGSIDKRMGPFISLEAMAKMTAHAFEVLGLHRIQAGQHVELSGWQQRMELLGYKLEGLHRKKFVKGHEMADAASIACIYEDYLSIISQRGNLWDSMDQMRTRFKNLPKKKFSEMMRDFVNHDGKNYYNDLFAL